ncbi:MAG: class I SAM-dependent methyltransferase [Desulfobacteraceae bacterium]|nr:MAG: class I SAM-dependent methyltransferase [Desulfobacteraceae bacterium]
MLKRILKRAFLILSSPIRYSIRYELRGISDANSQDQDIGKILQRRATESAADYVAKHMRDVDSVSSKLELLTKAIKSADLEKHNLICEFGVYTGNTINHIASLTNRTIYGFDSFEGLPERWRDGFGKGHFEVAALPKVRPNVVLIQGWFDRTLPAFIKDHDESIGFLHVDCDLYSSTRTIFELLGGRIHPGCVIVFDEYFNYPGWEECEYMAFKEFLRRTGLECEYICYNRLSEQVAVKIMSSLSMRST